MGNEMNTKDFRTYLLELEDHYMIEHKNLKNTKPFAAETERRMSILCRRILSEFECIEDN